MRRASVPLSARAPTCPRGAGSLAAARAADKARGGGLRSGSSVKAWRARRLLDVVVRRRSRSAESGECVASDARAGAAAAAGVSQTVTSGSRLMPASKKRGHQGDSKVGACQHPPCAGRLATAHVETGRGKASLRNLLSTPERRGSVRPDCRLGRPRRDAGRRAGADVGRAGREVENLRGRSLEGRSGEEGGGTCPDGIGGGRRFVRRQPSRDARANALEEERVGACVPSLSRHSARVPRASFGVLPARLTIRKALCKSAGAAIGRRFPIARRRVSSARRGRARRAGARRRPARRSGRALPGPTRRRSSGPSPPCRRAPCARRGGRSPRPIAAGRS